MLTNYERPGTSDNNDDDDDDDDVSLINREGHGITRSLPETEGSRARA